MRSPVKRRVAGSSPAGPAKARIGLALSHFKQVCMRVGKPYPRDNSWEPKPFTLQSPISGVKCGNRRRTNSLSHYDSGADRLVSLKMRQRWADPVDTPAVSYPILRMSGLDFAT